MNLSRREYAFEQRFRRKMAAWSRDSPWPGILACTALTLAAVYLNTLPFAPFTLAGGRHPVSGVFLALLLGIVIRNLFPLLTELKTGLRVVIAKILPTGILLLGAGLNIYDIVDFGLMIVMDAMLVIVLSLALARLLSRLLGVDEKQGILLGLGTAICGNVAIVAVGPMIDAEDKDQAFSIAVINLMGIIAMLSFPVISAIISLTPAVYGMWCGLSIHVSAHAIAVGFAYHGNAELAGQMATITKLARIFFLGPAIFAVAAVYAHQRRKHEAFVGQPVRYRQFIPTFVIMFFVMAFLRTTGLLPEITIHLTDRSLLVPGDYTVDIAEVLEKASKWLLTCGMAGVGLMTEFRMLRAGGMRSFVLGALLSLAMYGIGLALAALSTAG